MALLIWIEYIEHQFSEVGEDRVPRKTLNKKGSKKKINRSNYIVQYCVELLLWKFVPW